MYRSTVSRNKLDGQDMHMSASKPDIDSVVVLPTSQTDSRLSSASQIYDSIIAAQLREAPTLESA